MKKGYWIGNVIEIKNEERWNNYLTKYFQIEEKHKNEQTGNYLPILTGQPKGKIQGSNLMFAAVVEFNSLQDAIDCHNSKEYQEALIELGDNPEDTVIRNLSILRAVRKLFFLLTATLGYSCFIKLKISFAFFDAF